MTNIPSMDSATQLGSYRPLSALALTSALSGMFAVAAWIWPTLLVLAACGVIFGCATVRHLWGKTSVVAGLQLAAAGLAVSAGCLIGGSAWHWHRYAIEVPAGYERVSLSDVWELLPQEASKIGVAGQPARENGPSSASTDGRNDPPRDLEGRRIAVKVYPEPTNNISMTWFTVRRIGASGASPEPANSFIVRLRSGLSWDYTVAPIVVAGVLRSITTPADGTEWIVLDEATVRPATSAIGTPERRRGC